MFEPTSAEPCAPGLLAGKYRLDREIGRGGMGVVYQAKHLALEQRFAIKVVLPALASNPAVIQRLLREARCAAQITSDHVVRVIDVGQADSGQPFIVMEYVDGQDLASVLAERGRLPIPVAVHWLLEAAVALAEAHRKGIVHRDLKPGNLFLARTVDGRELIKVLDFGISKELHVSGEQAMTRANDVMGSPNYMAPEQIRTPLLVDARADLWALGAILLELLSGQRAFPGDTITAVYTRVLEGEPELPDPLAADLPGELRALVLRCLRKDPDDRFQTVHELVAALAPFAPARSGQALRAIARGLDGTLAESARTGRSLSGQSPSSAFASGSASVSRSQPRLRAWQTIAPGVLVGLVLSAACAALLGGPARWLDRWLSSAEAPPALESRAGQLARQGEGERALAGPGASALPEPRVSPISSAGIDVGQSEGAARAAREPAPRGAHAPSTAGAPEPNVASPEANTSPVAPAVLPAPALSNPWDISTFGGRS